jgi:outer membrane protein
MKWPRIPSLVFATLAAGVIAAPAALAADVVDIGYVDQSQLAALPAFQQANQQLAQYQANLQKQFIERARHTPASQQPQLGQQFQAQMADKSRQVMGPLFGKAQVAIASVASSKNLTVVIDKRIVIYGGTDITGDVRDLLSGAGDPVPPVSTPPPSNVGYVDQAQIDQVPSIKSASGDFAKFKADLDRTTSVKMKNAKTDADRQAILKDYQTTLENQQKATLQPLIDKTRNAMADVAKKRGLVLVVDRGNIIYGGTDITSDVTSAIK